MCFLSKYQSACRAVRLTPTPPPRRWRRAGGCGATVLLPSGGLGSAAAAARAAAARCHVWRSVARIRCGAFRLGSTGSTLPPVRGKQGAAYPQAAMNEQW